MAGTKPRSWWYPYIFVGMFAVIITVNGILFYFATSTFSGLGVTDAYEKGLHYNETLAQAKAQAELGWSVTAQAERDRLNVVVLDKAGQPIDGLEIVGFIDRPVTQGMLRDVVLANEGQGRYSAPLDITALGQWELQLDARRGGQLLYRLGERVVIN